MGMRTAFLRAVQAQDRQKSQSTGGKVGMRTSWHLMDAGTEMVAFL